jgi:hypothetical protein
MLACREADGNRAGSGVRDLQPALDAFQAKFYAIDAQGLSGEIAVQKGGFGSQGGYPAAEVGNAVDEPIQLLVHPLQIDEDRVVGRVAHF